MGSDGIRVAKGAMYAPDGTRLSLELQGYTSYEPLQRTEEFIVENLKAVGIEARIQNYDFSIIFGTYEDNSPRAIGDYDMLIFDRGFTTEPQGYVSEAYSSTTMPSAENPTGGNYFRWSNPMWMNNYKLLAAISISKSARMHTARSQNKSTWIFRRYIYMFSRMVMASPIT